MNNRKAIEAKKEKFEDLAATLEFLQCMEYTIGHDDRLKNKDINEEINQIVVALISAEEKVYASYTRARLDYLSNFDGKEESL